VYDVSWSRGVFWKFALVLITLSLITWRFSACKLCTCMFCFLCLAVTVLKLLCMLYCVLCLLAVSGCFPSVLLFV
jgi:hypothetical protein